MLKKMAPNFGAIFFYGLLRQLPCYFAGASAGAAAGAAAAGAAAGLAGADAGAGAGAVVCTGAGAIDDTFLAGFSAKEAQMLITQMKIARPQVAFSMKSVVLR